MWRSISEAGHRRRLETLAVDQGPALRIGALDRRRFAAASAMWSSRARTICRIQALAGPSRFSGPRIVGDDFEGGPLAAAERARGLCRAGPRPGAAPRRSSRRGRGRGGRGRAGRGRPRAARPRSRLERNSPTGSGRVAVVEEQHGAAEQVVAGDHQLALGLVEDDVRGGVAGGLVDLPGAVVGLHLDPGDELAVGLADPVDPGLGRPSRASR